MHWKSTLEQSPGLFAAFASRLRHPCGLPAAGYLRASRPFGSNNGPQFIAKDFKEFVRVAGLTHLKTSPYYPQSNGKIQRWHKSLKADGIRPGSPLDIEQARGKGPGAQALSPEKSQTSSRDAARGRLGQGGRRIAGGLYGIILPEPQFEPNAVTACLPQVAADGL